MTIDAPLDDPDLSFDAAEEPTDAQRKSVSDLAERERREYRACVAATKALQDALAAWRHTRNVLLPEALREIRQSYFRLLDRTPVSLETVLVSGKVTDPARLARFEALGGADLIKCVITIEVDRENVVEARALLNELRGHRLANHFKKLKLEEFIHQSTAPSFVNELIESGQDPPLDELGVTRLSFAQVGERRPKTVEIKGVGER